MNILLEGIGKAQKSIEVTIFRFDRPDIEMALAEAVLRGVFVHALVARTNRGGEQKLRKLEKRFLARGITVSRTADDLIRYHAKMMLVDRQELFVLGFNFTELDIDYSRSFGIVTSDHALVREAILLFEADSRRQQYLANIRTFLVSPINARKELGRFIRGAREELLIYDPKISDSEMLGLLKLRRRAGVNVRVIGSVNGEHLPASKLKGMRLHTRTIIRDRADAFLGSQSLRQLELDQRREVGLIFREPSIVRQLIQTFEQDWQASSPDSADRPVATLPVGTRSFGELVASLKLRIPFPPIVRQIRNLFGKRRRPEKPRVRAVGEHAPFRNNRKHVA